MPISAKPLTKSSALCFQVYVYVHCSKDLKHYRYLFSANTKWLSVLPQCFGRNMQYFNTFVLSPIRYFLQTRSKEVIAVATSPVDAFLLDGGLKAR